ncbi:MAG TPA: gamma-glutamyl-gamma-aminobutyrate hydrolase family protein [Solirubrobacterales bacterium]|nr:gamma-glutamyl-gamma-aminobutyrate hydrolase family protein [Solirubrobacterales bacterium]
MRILAIVHQRDAGPGVFAEAIAEAGAELEEWTPAERPPPPADPFGYDAVFVLGGAMNVDEGERHSWIAEEEELLRELLARDVPLLGLCLGAQLLAAAAGAQPRRAARPEIGWQQVEVTVEGAEDPLLGPLAPGFEAFQWHSYEFPLPPGAVPLARSPACLQACRLGERAWALQFHPEVSRADALHWIDDYEADPDAVRIGIDPAALRPETEAKIGAFNHLGRELCRRWLEVSRPV